MRASKHTGAVRSSATLCALAALLLAALAGCGSGNESTSVGTVNLMKVTAGKDFTISLRSNQTTGYQWQLDGSLNEKVVKKVNSEYKADPAGAQTTGAGGVEIWTFKAMGKGSAEIKMKYVRPWEKGAKPAEQRVFKVTVD